MAASSGSQDNVKMEKTNNEVEVSHGSDQTGVVSNQLLYADNYSECYQENKLNIVRKKISVTGRLETVNMPPSSVLSRIKKFLPELSLANKEMALEMVSNPDSADRFNIEHLGPCDGKHIEMNLSVVAPELIADDDSSTDDESSSENEFSSEQLSEESGENLREVKQTLKLHLTSKCSKPGIEIIDGSATS